MLITSRKISIALMAFSAVVGAAASCNAAAGNTASGADPSDDGYVARLRALALLETFNAELLSHDSATETLQRWCDDHGLAPGVRIAAKRLRGVDKAADDDVRRDLGAGPAEPVRYRRVQLTCGDYVLSEADNWYLPRRLTAEMNRRLDETEQPFGAVVKSLGFHRRTLNATLLFHPLAAGWEGAGRRAEGAADPMPPPPYVLRHRTLLTTGDGAPFSLVVETYTDRILAVVR